MVETVSVSAAPDRPMVTILARRGADATAIGEAMGIEMPVGPNWTAGADIMVCGTGPGTWLASGEGSEWLGALEARLAGLAGVIDQTGAYRVLHFEGPEARTLLQRGASVDLSGSAFPAGAVASTVIGHVDAIICCIVEGQAYEVAVYESYAESFLRWIDRAIVAIHSERGARLDGEVA